MAIQDLGYANNDWRTGHAPSRVRTMLKRLRAKLAGKDAGSRMYGLLGGPQSTGTDLLPLVDEALAEWTKLDDLISKERRQRQRIDTLLTPLVSFYVAIHAQILQINPKKRRKRTAAQKLLSAAKARETRRLRGTLGKRQKRKIKANAEDLTVIVGGSSPRSQK